MEMGTPEGTEAEEMVQSVNCLPNKHEHLPELGPRTHISLKKQDMVVFLCDLSSGDVEACTSLGLAG